MLPLILLVVGVLTQQTFAEEPEAIVGGQSAAPGEFPHQVSLRLYGDHICGGSIIAPNKILTAAHCVDDLEDIAAEQPYGHLQIATGTIYNTDGQLHSIKNVVMHPEFSDNEEDAWKNDIAVITLESPIQYNQFQKPISLAKLKPVLGQKCTLSGWGRISKDGPLSHVLQKMNQVVVAKSTCQQRHHNVSLSSSHLCTFNRFGIGTCTGDSGGPLICNGAQYGVVSWGLPCAQGEPDVYTDVYFHLDFINNA